MTQTIEVSLVDILNKIDSKIDKFGDQLNNKIDKFADELNNKIDKVSDELNNKIDKVSDELNNKIDKVSDELKETRQEINQIHTDVEKIKIQNDQMGKRLDNVESRLNSMNIGFLSIVGVLVAGLLGIIGKLSFFP